MSARMLSAAVLAALLACAPRAGAQDAPAQTTQAQDLYERALQYIAEGRKLDASDTLMRVIENEPNHAGAYLEVALIQCGIGRALEAERLFDTIVSSFHPSQGILEVIANARAGGCTNWKPLTTATAMVARGYDNNVNQGARNPVYIVERDGGQIELMPLLEDFRPRADSYTATSADYMRELTPNGVVGFVQAMARHNDSAGRFDSSSAYAGLEAPYRFGKVNVRGTAIAGMVALGGRLYQRQYQLQGRAALPLPRPELQFGLVGGITHAEYLALTNFNSDIYELRAQLTWRSERLFASASAGYSYDNARALRPGGDRKGISVNLLVRTPLGERATGELGYTGQTWLSAEAYSPPLISQVRDQATHMLRATLAYPIREKQSLQLELRAVHNSENISIFQYNSRLVQLSWHLQFK